MQYEILPKSGLVSGELIENRAYIYFDFNPAIITNTVWHTIGDCFDKSGTTPLPLELIYFEGEKINKHAVALKWEVGHSENVRHFELMRSLDGYHYENIKLIIFNETKSVYEHIDYISDVNQAYYRLKTIDF